MAKYKTKVEIFENYTSKKKNFYGKTRFISNDTALRWVEKNHNITEHTVVVVAHYYTPDDVEVLSFERRHSNGKYYWVRT